MGRVIRFSVCAACLVFPALAQIPLASWPAGRTPYAGYFFELEAINDITACELWVDLDNSSEFTGGLGPPRTLTLYSRPGTYLGHENSAAGWTLVGVAQQVRGHLIGPKHIPIAFTQNLAAGQRRAYHLVVTDDLGLPVAALGRGSSATLQNTTEDSNLRLRIGPSATDEFQPTPSSEGLRVVVLYGTGLNNTCGNADLPATPVPTNLFDGPAPGGVGPLTAGRVYVMPPGQAQVPPGETLTVEPGAILKFGRGSASSLRVRGNLIAEEAVFTSTDDDLGGVDTSGIFFPAPSGNPSPGDWDGLFMDPGIGSQLRNVEIGYAGGSSIRTPLLFQFTTSATVEGSYLHDNGPGTGYVIDLNRNSTVTIQNNFIVDNDVPPIGDVNWDALPGFCNNVASNNAGGDYLKVSADTTGTFLNTNITINPTVYPGDAMVAEGRLLVDNGNVLCFEDDVIIKWIPGTQASIEARASGTVDIRGTGRNPVIFTSFLDDTIAGDTNDDGALSMPAPGDWGQVSYIPGSTGQIEHVEMNFGGMGSLAQPALELDSSMVSVEALEIANSISDALRLNDAASISNVLVRNSGGRGIYSTGAVEINHATIINNNGIGIDRLVGTSATVTNSIAWNNTGGNYGTDFTSADVFSSLGGFAGSNGNIDQDPLLDPLSLAPGPLSPARDTADPSLVPTTLFFDLRDNPRQSGSTAEGMNVEPDMGAVEAVVRRFRATGPLLLGTSLTMSFEGPDLSNSTAVIAASLTPPQPVFIPTIGPVGIGNLAQAVIFPPIPADLSIPVTLPDLPILNGLPLNLQAYITNPNESNLSNLQYAIMRN